MSTLLVEENTICTNNFYDKQQALEMLIPSPLYINIAILFNFGKQYPECCQLNNSVIVAILIRESIRASVSSVKRFRFFLPQMREFPSFATNAIESASDFVYCFAMKTHCVRKTNRKNSIKWSPK